MPRPAKLYTISSNNAGSTFGMNDKLVDIDKNYNKRHQISITELRSRDGEIMFEAASYVGSRNKFQKSSSVTAVTYDQPKISALLGNKATEPVVPAVS